PAATCRVARVRAFFASGYGRVHALPGSKQIRCSRAARCRRRSADRYNGNSLVRARPDGHRWAFRGNDDPRSPTLYGLRGEDPRPVRSALTTRPTPTVPHAKSSSRPGNPAGVLFRRNHRIARPTGGRCLVGANGRTANRAARHAARAALAIGRISVQAKLGALVAIALRILARATLLAAPPAVATITMADVLRLTAFGIPAGASQHALRAHHPGGAARALIDRPYLLP